MTHRLDPATLRHVARRLSHRADLAAERARACDCPALVVHGAEARVLHLVAAELFTEAIRVQQEVGEVTRR